MARKHGETSVIARAVTYLVTAVIGAALGIASAVYMAGLWPGMKPLDFGDVEVGGWRSDFAIGSGNADPYTRARVARHGLLALAKSEAVYFTRTTDGLGRPLTEDCSYTLSISDMPAGWWSVTLYNAESYLPKNADDALSVNASQVRAAVLPSELEPASTLVTIASERPDKGLWISSRNAGRFDLTLRLYMPEKALLEDPEATLNAPLLQRESCDGDPP